MSFGIIAAMENAENEVGADQNEVEAAQTETEVVRAEAEINEDVVEISSDEKDMGEAVEAADELQEMGEVAQAAVDSGEGLSEDAAAMATVAIERISLKMFGTRAQSIVPARESFGSSNSRLAATVAVVEGIVDTIKRIWKGIKAFAMRIWDKIKMLWTKVIGSTKNYEKHLKNLRERAAALDPAATLKENDIKNESLAKSITSDDGKASYDTFKDHADRVRKFFDVKKELDSAVRAVSVDVQTMANSMLKGDEKQAFKDGGVALKKAAAAFTKLSNVKPIAIEGVENKGDTAYLFYGPLSGGIAIEVATTTVPKTDYQDESFIINIGTRKLAKKQIADKVASLSRSDILNVCDIGLELIKLVEGKNGELKAAEAITKATSSAADVVIKQADELVKNDDNKSKTLNDLKKTVDSVNRYVNAVNSLIMSNSANVIAAAANYASAGLANVKFKKK